MFITSSSKPSFLIHVYITTSPPIMQFFYHVIRYKSVKSFTFLINTSLHLKVVFPQSCGEYNTGPLMNQRSFNDYYINNHPKFAIAYLKNSINFLAKSQYFYLQPCLHEGLDRVEGKFCLLFGSSMPTEGKLLTNPGSVNYNKSSHNDGSMNTNYYLLLDLCNFIFLDRAQGGNN